MATTMTSQVASSLTSLGVNIAVARVATVDQFGAFGLLFGTNLLIATLVRSFLVEPLVVETNRTQTPSAEVIRRRHASVTGAALVLPLPLAVGLGIALLVEGGALPAVAVAAGCAGVVVAVAQDAAKTYCIGTRRTHVSLRSDSAWLMVQVVVTGLSFADVLTTTQAIAGWGLGALVGFVTACRGLRARPAPRRGLALAWSNRRTGTSWMVDSALVNAIGQAIPWVLAVSAGAAAVASYRGALVLLGPSTVILTGLRLVSLPSLARTAPPLIPARTIRLVGVYAVVALLCGVPLLLVPDPLGEALLGDSWSVGRAVLPAAIAWRVAASMGTPPLLSLRAQRETRSVLAVRVWVSILTVAAGFTGALLDGARGAFLGLTLASLGSLPVWQAAVRRAAARHTAAVDTAPAGARSA